MKYFIVFKFLLILGTFGGIYFFWYKNQSMVISFNASSILETKEDISIASFGGSYEEEALTISNTSPSVIYDSIKEDVTMPSSPIVSIDNIATKEDAVILNLKNAFSKKYNKDVSNVAVFIENLQTPFIKGSVDFDNSGYTATFYAYKFLETNDWEIVAVENGVVACTIIDPYNFPSNIISQCYSYSSGTVVNR